MDEEILRTKLQLKYNCEIEDKTIDLNKWMFKYIYEKHKIYLEKINKIFTKFENENEKHNNIIIDCNIILKNEIYDILIYTCLIKNLFSIATQDGITLIDGINEKYYVSLGNYAKISHNWYSKFSKILIDIHNENKIDISNNVKKYINELLNI